MFSFNLSQMSAIEIVLQKSKKALKKHVTESHVVKAKKSLHRAEGHNNVCLLGYPFFEKIRRPAGQEKTGQYHSVFQEGILLYMCLNNRGLLINTTA